MRFDLYPELELVHNVGPLLRVPQFTVKDIYWLNVQARNYVEQCKVRGHAGEFILVGIADLIALLPSRLRRQLEWPGPEGVESSFAKQREGSTGNRERRDGDPVASSADANAIGIFHEPVVAPADIKACCLMMRCHLERSADDGLSAVVTDGDFPSFFLQFRSYPVRSEDEYRRHLATCTDGPRLVTGQRMPISHCPWCGRNLRPIVNHMQAKRLGFDGYLRKVFLRSGS